MKELLLLGVIFSLIMASPYIVMGLIAIVIHAVFDVIKAIFGIKD